MMGKNARHKSVQEVLPWFVNRSLGEKESNLVLRHLKECRECRQERDCLQLLQQEVVEDQDEIPDYRFSYRKLQTRIDAAEKNRETTEDYEVERSAARGPWAAFAGAAATLVMGVIFVASMQPAAVDAPGPGDFLTLTVPGTGDDGVKHRFALTFEKGVSPETVRAALIQSRSSLVSGPDEKGTWVVDIRVPEGVSDTDFIQSVRTIDGIEYAAFVEDKSDPAR